MQEEAKLREKINKITKINKIFTLLFIIGAIILILAAGTIGYFVITHMGVFTNFQDIVEGAPLFFILATIGGLTTTLGLIPSFYLNIKKAKLLEELKQLTKASPACAR